MKHNNTTIEPVSGEVFAEAIMKAEGPEYFALATHYADEMRKAVEGRICTPERMALLYPIFRDINIEQDEINAF